MGFNKVKHFGSTNVLQRLLINLRYKLEWSLLNIGAFYNFQPGLSGFDDHLRLRPEFTPGYDDGQSWSGLRKNWVWETGVEYTDVTGGLHYPLDPIIYVSGIPVSSGYEVDYDLGRVIFEDAIPTNSDVKAEYSAKNVQVYLGDEAPWFQELQMDGWDYTNHFQQDTEGNWFVNAKHRVQLPSIIVSCYGDGTKRPYSLGGRTTNTVYEVVYLVLAQDFCTRNNLVDMLLLESSGSCFPLFNVDAALTNCHLQIHSYRENDNRIFPELVNRYHWANCRGENSVSFDLDTPLRGLYTGFCKVDYSVWFNSI